MSKGGTRIQRKVKAGQRARKGKRCPRCNRVTKIGRTCQFHKQYEE